MGANSGVSYTAETCACSRSDYEWYVSRILGLQLLVKYHYLQYIIS